MQEVKRVHDMPMAAGMLNFVGNRVSAMLGFALGIDFPSRVMAAIDRHYERAGRRPPSADRRAADEAAAKARADAQAQAQAQPPEARTAADGSPASLRSMTGEASATAGGSFASGGGAGPGAGAGAGAGAAAADADDVPGDLDVGVFRSLVLGLVRQSVEEQTAGVLRKARLVGGGVLAAWWLLFAYVSWYSFVERPRKRALVKSAKDKVTTPAIVADVEAKRK
jgi:hypothetical protein